MIFEKFSTFWDPRSQIRVRSGDFRDSGPKNVSGTRFVSRIRPIWGSGTLFSTILGPLAMYWKCFQRFLESLIYALIFNLDFAENFVVEYYPGQLENPALVGMCAPTETRLRRDNMSYHLPRRRRKFFSDLSEQNPLEMHYFSSKTSK